VNGARLRAAEQLRSESATLVFTPDRLAIVKAGPAARRAYFDRTLGRVLPARASLSPDYAAALAQRNAGLKRGDRDALAPWTAQLASIGAELVAARTECLALLAGPFAESAGALGLPESRLAYEGDPPTVEALEASWIAISSAARPGSARICTTSRSRPPARPALVRLAGRAADRRCSRSCSPRRRC
jgi:DNA replication and repair protein RecF